MGFLLVGGCPYGSVVYVGCFFVLIRFHTLGKLKFLLLSSKRWTEIQCCKPRESIELRYSQVVIGSCIYRVAYEVVSLLNQYMIVSFDLIAKEFKAIDLPDKIVLP